MKRLGLLAVLLVLVTPASAAAPRILPTRDLWPVWGPNGLFVYTRISGSLDLLELTSVSARGHVQLAASRSQLQPDWSPDGHSLVYAAFGAVYTEIVDDQYKRNPARLTPKGERAFAPRWSPDGARIAYLTTRGARNTDLWTATLTPAGSERALLAKDVIGVAAWSPDARAVAFQRDDGIYIADVASRVERRVAAIANPGPPAFSHDEKQIAFAAGDRMRVVAADGLTAPRSLGVPRRELGTPSWSADDSSVVYARAGAVEEAFLAGGSRPLFSFADGGGGVTPFRPGTPDIAFSGPRPSCPGHVAIRLLIRRRFLTTLTGSCFVTGTAHADSIEGGIGRGDEIFAGAGNDTVHANDGHPDRVDCGAGRDVVYADRTDTLHGCETIRR